MGVRISHILAAGLTVAVLGAGAAQAAERVFGGEVTRMAPELRPWTLPVTARAPDPGVIRPLPRPEAKLGIEGVRPRARPWPAEPAVFTPGPGDIRPKARTGDLPRTRWERQSNAALWTRVLMSSLAAHGQPLIDTVPRDIAQWCPTYATQGPEGRAAFWAGLVSSLAFYESTWNPQAVGGGGLWHGLMQILPDTAEFRGCRAETGRELRHGPSNLSCAVRIMGVTVPRDNAIAVRGESRWLGVAADWGPIRNARKRASMQAYTKRQVYCRPLSEVRPRPRPVAG